MPAFPVIGPAARVLDQVALNHQVTGVVLSLTRTSYADRAACQKSDMTTNQPSAFREARLAVRIPTEDRIHLYEQSPGGDRAQPGTISELSPTGLLS